MQLVISHHKRISFLNIVITTCIGPNPESLTDFWRMIWEYKVPTIAMLTRCYEGGKVKESHYRINFFNAIFQL